MKSKYFLFLCLSFLIFNSSLLIGTIRYVSKTGTSIPPYTNWQTAADSIQKCINICVDGDTVYVGVGTYIEKVTVSRSITFIGMSMDSCIIDGSNELSEGVVRFTNNSVIENFTVIARGQNLTTDCVQIFYTNVFMKNCKVLNGRIGIHLTESSSSIQNCLILYCSWGIGTMSTDSCKSFFNGNIIISKNSFDAAFYHPFGGSTNTKNNLILCEENSSLGVSFESQKRVVFENNLISGFKRNNVQVRSHSDTVFVRNNNSMNVQNESAFDINYYDKTVTSNNIIKNSNIGFNGGVKSDYNLFHNVNTPLNGGAYLGQKNVFADPMFVKDTIPTLNGEYDLHLQKYSPAIDAGDPNILDIDGSRSDIGMFGGPLGQIYTYQDLAPKPPRNLTTSMDSGLVHLKWNKNTEADLFRYRVYRDTVPDFIYDTTKIIAVLSDTTFYDDPPQKFISGNYYYKVTAIDSAYHQSPASEETHINITGIPEAPPIIVEHYNLLQNYPNPFNPSTTIPYRLKAPGYVKVMVYNLLGEQVKVLVNKYQSAGYYEVLFHPTATERQSAEGKIEFETGYGDIVSGIYLYRIEVIGEGNIPVFTDMKKMMLVK